VSEQLKGSLADVVAGDKVIRRASRGWGAQYELLTIERTTATQAIVKVGDKELRFRLDGGKCITKHYSDDKFFAPLHKFFDNRTAMQVMEDFNAESAREKKRRVLMAGIKTKLDNDALSMETLEAVARVLGIEVGNA